MSDTGVLLAWMRTQPGDVCMRAIGENGPRAFRRKADAEPALAALVAAGRLVEVSRRPRAFRVVRPGTAPGRSGSKVLDMLADAAADCGDVPAELAAYWSAISVRSRLVSSMRVRNGLPAECECCGSAGRAVDRAVVEAFDCEMPD